MTIYRALVPNLVIITSLSHFNHVFKMAEVADEPNEYLSDDQEERGSVSNTKGKDSSRGAAKYRTKFNTEWEGAYPVKRVQSDAYSFWCVPCNKRVRCDQQGLINNYLPKAK